MNKPKISIITITYNAVSTLERTIKSVEKLNFPSIEYIVVDGASTDGTLDLIHKYSYVITKYISKPDDGIYDAMNRGIDMASGEYVWFVNAGDEIYEPDTISKLFACSTDADIFYGDTVMTDMQGNIIGNRRLQPPSNLSWKSFKNGMLVSHQSFIPKLKICKYYDTQYKFSADFDWCINAMKNATEICNTHLILSKFLDGGITKHNIKAGLKERFRIMRKHYGLLSTILYHIPISIKFFWFLITKGRF